MPSLYTVGIYYVSYDIAHLWSIKSLPENVSLISNSSIWSHRVIFEIWYHSHRAVRRVPNSGFWGKTRPSRTYRAAGRLQKYFSTFGSCSRKLMYPTTTGVCIRWPLQSYSGRNNAPNSHFNPPIYWILGLLAFWWPELVHRRPLYLAINIIGLCDVSAF